VDFEIGVGDRLGTLRVSMSKRYFSIYNTSQRATTYRNSLGRGKVPEFLWVFGFLVVFLGIPAGFLPPMAYFRLCVFSFLLFYVMQ
jgi:hypothetical protein